MTLTRSEKQSEVRRDSRQEESRKPIRVVHVIPTLGLGGAEALLYRLVRQPSDIDHRVICLRGRDWYSERIEAKGVPVEHLDLGIGVIGLARSWRLWKLFRKHRPDVIQAWTYSANVSAGIWGRVYGAPVVWGVHHSTPETLRLPFRVLVHLSGILARYLPSLIVSCSTKSASVHAKIGYDRAPGQVICNGYDADEFHPDLPSRSAVRRSLGIADATFLLGNIGRWHAQKDTPNLLRAIGLMRTRGIPLSCLLIGQNLDEENSQLVEAAERAGATEIIRALGRRADVVELARALDLHVLPSGGEAFPNVVAETMLSGTPNIVTDVGDAALMVGDTGWVVPPRNSEALAAAIETAYIEWRDEGARWQDRQAAARARISSKFTLEQMAATYEEVWARVVASAKPNRFERSQAANPKRQN